MKSKLLSEDDVAEITGFKIKSKQIEALKNLGIRFFKRNDGRPIVPSSAVDAALGLLAQEPSYQEDDGFNLIDNHG